MSPAIVIIGIVLAIIASTLALIVRGVSSGQKLEREAADTRKKFRALGPVKGLTVRPLAASDEAAWHRMWDSYCYALGEDVLDSATKVTWQRLLEPGSALQGFVAVEPEGTIVGFGHVVLHPHTWSPRLLCYVEDLYVDLAWRGRSVGHEILSFLWRRAEEQGWSRVYWHTETANAAARRLYDRFRPADAVVRYTLTISEK